MKPISSASGTWAINLSSVQTGMVSITFYGFHAGAIDYISHSNDLYENEQPTHRDGYLTDIWADKAIEIIQKKHSKPFFLAVTFNAPHLPWQGPGDKPYPDTMRWTSGGSPTFMQL